MDNVNRDHKVLIVGGGPAGLTAAIYAARANLNPILASGEVTQSGQLPGGQLMITSEVENYPGFPEGIQGPELMERFVEQAKRFGTKIVEAFATDFEFKTGGPHRAKVGDETYEVEAIILANGAAAKWLNAPGELDFRNRGISACATCDGPLPIFRNKHIYVIGGGDSAVEEATFLTRFASKVTLIHRRDTLRASKIMIDRAHKNEKIDFLWNTTVVGYKGGDKGLTHIITENVQSGETAELETNGVFMAIGHEPLTKELQGSGIDLDERGYIVVKNNVETSIEGVFACGDVHDTTFRQAITASGFGCMAAIATERWLEAKHANVSKL